MRRAASAFGRALYWLALTATVAFLIVPAVLVFILSFSNDPAIVFPPQSWGVRNYETLATVPAWGDAMLLSVVLALVVGAGAAAIAVPAAYALEKTRLSRLQLLSFFAILPLLVPQAAYAIGMYVVMAQLGLLGDATGLALAQIAICFPFAFIIVRSHFSRLPPDLDLVAMTLGATRRQAWTGVTLRLLVPAITAGFLFAFLTSFDEAVFANFLAGPNLVTLPKAIFDSVRLGVDPVITAIASMLMVFTAVVMGLVSYLRRVGGSH